MKAGAIVIHPGAPRLIGSMHSFKPGSRDDRDDPTLSTGSPRGSDAGKPDNLHAAFFGKKAFNSLAKC